MSRRLDCFRVFLTFPQNDTTPTVALQRMVETEKELEYAVVGREPHADGQPHLHVYAKMKKRTRVTLRHFDYVGSGKHGNYQRVVHPAECLAYVMKGGDYVAHGCDPKELLAKLSGQKKEKLSDQIARAIIEGASDAELLATHPGFVLLQGHRIASFRLLATAANSATRIPPNFGEITVRNDNDVSGQVWCLDRTLSAPFRTPAIWIYGPTKTGKSSVFLELSKSLEGFLLPFNNDFRFYADNAYDFAYCDEFHGQLTVTFLNEWIQGTPMNLNTKGSTVRKTHNLTTLICSNYSPFECFPKARQLDTLLGRLVVVSVPPGSFALDFLTFVLRPRPQVGAAAPTTPSGDAQEA